MPHTVIESDSYSASVTAPNAGELVKAADVENAVQPVANRTKNHETHGFFDVVKRAAGNTLTYLLGSGGKLRVGAGSVIELIGSGKIKSFLSAAGPNTPNLDGWFERNGMMYRSGNGARERHRRALTSDGSTDITVSFDTWVLPQASQNNVRTVRTSTPTDLQQGERVLIVRTTSDQFVGDFTETIVSESGVTLFTFGVNGAGNGINGFVLLEYGQTFSPQTSPDWFPIMASTFEIGQDESGWWGNA